MTVYRDFDTPDAFTTAALGRPGQRVFLIQVRGEGVSVVDPVGHVGLIAKRGQVSLSSIRPRPLRAQGPGPWLACVIY